ncbi:MAG: Cupin 2 conserved barrel domain protein [Solirubrobacterales bacterium]|jgi:quercetin dioxygenase-like cupin family protein|nr:Cupin 2 conserved barrel domain protein [Solirubrobacterales bacterium]
MQSWDLARLDVQPHHPEVLASDEEGRVIAIHLPAGERLQEHQVHERAWLVVASGAVEIDDASGETITGGPGLLAAFEPNERHEVRATEDARLLLVLSPWPGDGHPSTRGD